MKNTNKQSKDFTLLALSIPFAIAILFEFGIYLITL
jgi:hypothetical protein